MPQTGKRGPGRPPAAQAADTRERILRAACEVFTELGYDAATFQAIASRSDLTRPAINHYFSSKKILYNAVLDQMNGRLLAAAATRAQSGHTLVDRLTMFIEAAIEADEENQSAAGFLSTAVLEGQRHPGLTPPEKDPLELLRQILKWAVAESVASGELPAGADTTALVDLLLSMVWGMGFFAGFVGGHEELRHMTVQIRLLFEHRLMASPTEPRPAELH